MEEELRLDLGPALEAIRGELTRALEEVPATFRAAFGDSLEGIVRDFGAAAELARGEVDKAFSAPVPLTVDTAALDALPAQIEAAATPVDVPVAVDASELDGLPAEIAGAGGPVDVPVEVDTTEIQEAADEIEALDGQTVTVDTAVDTSGLKEAANETENLGEAAKTASGGFGDLQANVANVVSGIADLNDFGAGRAGVAALTGVIFGFGAAAIDADAKLRSFNSRVGDLAATLNRVDVAGLNTDLATLAIQIGADDDNLRLALANFVQLGTESGRTRKELGQLGQELTALAAYLSVTNPALGTANQIAENLPTALARGGRALVPYGIALNAATVQQRALSDSGKATAAELTIFDRSAAGLAITVENLGSKLKANLDEGLQTPAVRLRAIKVAVEETIESLGSQFIQPILDISTEAGPALQDLASGVAKAGDAFASVLVPAVKVAAPLVSTIADGFKSIPSPVLDTAAALYLASKALTVVEAGLTVVSGAALKTFAAVTVSGPAFTALAAAEETAAAATAANAEAQIALQIATAEAVASANVDVAAEERRALAMQAAATAAEAEALALKGLGEASIAAGAGAGAGAAAATRGQLGIVAISALLANQLLNAIGVLHKTKEEFSGLATVTDQELIPAFIKASGFRGDIDPGVFFQSNAKEATRRFKDLAEQSTETATRVRDAMRSAGYDTAAYDKILDGLAATAKAAGGAQVLSAENAQHATERAYSGAVTSISGYQSALHDVIDLEGEKAAADDAATKFAADNAAAVQAQADAANNAESAFSAATGALATYLGLAADEGTQGLEFAITLDKLKEKQDAYLKSKGAAGPAYALETAAGRENIAALKELVSQQAQVFATNVKNGEDIPHELDNYRKRIDAIREVAKQTGLTDAQYQGLLESFNLTPEKVSAAVSITGVADAKAQVDEFRSTVEKVPLSLRVTTTVDISELYKQIAAANEGQRNAKNPVIIDTGFGLHEGGLVTTNAEGSVSPLLGPLRRYAAGGIEDLQRYANGEDHTAQIATGYRLFGEPETGGEAYIPLGSNKRQRSTELLDEVAGRFGYDLVPTGAARYAGGDVVGGGQAWDDGRMVGVLSSILDALTSLPGKIPVSQDVNASIELTGDERDTLSALGRRLRSAQARR